MSDSKYHSIDPLILETLNLNEQRMNHILNILHGKQERKETRTQRKSMNHSLSKYQTIATSPQEDTSLPPILLTNRKNMLKIKEKEEIEIARRLIKNQYIGQMTPNYSLDKSKTVEKTQKGQRSERRYDRSIKSQKKLKQQRTLQQQLINIEEETQKFQQHKRQQIMKDYMFHKLKKSKSQELNPKDIYRFEMESIIAELTPIEELMESQKRMQRLKRRHKHLVVFDKNYYMKLNEHDMLNLS